MSTIDLKLLGALEVRANRADGTEVALTQPKRLALLLYLALAEPPGMHARDRLLALLWPEADDASSRHSLRNALHGLRQALGSDAIITRGESYVGLDFGAVRCDALALRAHLAAGRLDDAVSLWAGELAPGFHVSGAAEFERWLDEQRAALHAAVRSAAWARARELEGAGSAETESLRRALRLDPSHEPGVRRLMRVLAAAGDRAGAVRAYQQLADYLREELEAQPSSQTQALNAELRSDGAVIPTSRAVPAARVSPPLEVAEGGMAAPAGAMRELTGDLATPAADAAPSPAPNRRARRRRRAIAAGTLGVLALGSGSLVARRPSARAMPQAETQIERAALRLPARYRTDTSAYSSYLRGLTLRLQFRFVESRDTLAALVDRAPLYVPGLYGLAHAYIFTTLNRLSDEDETWPKIDALAHRALALDSTAGSAWLALASENMFRRLDLGSARKRIARARMLDSLDPDAAGMQSVWFRFHGQMDSAVAYARLAHRIDPLSVFFARLVAKQLFFARRYEESRSMYAQLLHDEPGSVRNYLDAAELYQAMGRPRDAVEWYRRVRAAQGDSAGAAALPPAATDSAATVLLAADVRHTIARLDRAAQAGVRVPAMDYARAYATLGDTAATLRWLDAMVARNDSYLHQVRLDPVFDFLRKDLRYRAWEARTGLPPLDGGAAR